MSAAWLTPREEEEEVEGKGENRLVCHARFVVVGDSYTRLNGDSGCGAAADFVSRAVVVGVTEVLQLFIARVI